MLALVVSAFALSSVMRSTAAQSADDACITDPTMASCDSYVYPEDQVIADIQLNCQQMPWMIGCSVWDACMDGSMGEDNRYCNPFSVLSTQCVDQGMEMMGGCLNYVGMCRTGSMVPQCDEFPPIPNVVSTVPSQVRNTLTPLGYSDVFLRQNDAPRLSLVPSKQASRSLACIKFAQI